MNTRIEPEAPAAVSGAPATRQPAIYLPHGGGPCFFMEWPPGRNPWERMGGFLRGVLPTLPSRPKAILVVSGHWEEPRFTVNTGEAPALFFDYYGFPEHTYRLSYPAPGEPALAGRIRDLLEAAGLPAGEDDARGFDHGVFVPFLLVDPQASIPVVQLSLQRGLDPATHIAAGRALERLRDEGVLVVGSGMGYPNMRGFGPGFEAASRRFDDWLTATVEDADPQRRDAALSRWEQAPDARVGHPREEHLVPLMVAAGAAGADRGTKVFEDRIPSVTVSAFRFG
jgi:aromatic ring-opening dioxygenase catalytic subunit (LigB family)